MGSGCTTHKDKGPRQKNEFYGFKCPKCGSAVDPSSRNCKMEGSRAYHTKCYKRMKSSKTIPSAKGMSLSLARVRARSLCLCLCLSVSLSLSLSVCLSLSFSLCLLCFELNLSCLRCLNETPLSL